MDFVENLAESFGTVVIFFVGVLVEGESVLFDGPFNRFWHVHGVGVFLDDREEIVSCHCVWTVH